TLSVRTVERHLSHVYLKLGISGRSARTAAVARPLREKGRVPLALHAGRHRPAQPPRAIAY
ncbi:MAG: hypothetical protein ACR2JZ_01335, partial [Candidatus Limnocylindrales bacterium]